MYNGKKRKAKQEERKVRIIYKNYLKSKNNHKIYVIYFLF